MLHSREVLSEHPRFLVFCRILFVFLIVKNIPTMSETERLSKCLTKFVIIFLIFIYYFSRRVKGRPTYAPLCFKPKKSEA